LVALPFPSPTIGLIIIMLGSTYFLLKDELVIDGRHAAAVS